MAPPHSDFQYTTEAQSERDCRVALDRWRLLRASGLFFLLRPRGFATVVCSGKSGVHRLIPGSISDGNMSDGVPAGVMHRLP
jgi:hypothetical protein